MPARRARIFLRIGSIEFLKINAARQDWRDGYHWVLSLGTAGKEIVLQLASLSVGSG